MFHCILPDVNVSYVIIYHSISAPGHVREVAYVLNAINKRFPFLLMSHFNIMGAKHYDTQMIMHTRIRTYDVSLTRKFLNTCLMWHANME